MSKEKLVLLDAHALIHRAYHAIPTDLLSPTGEPTKAVYGFTSTLLKVIKDQGGTTLVQDEATSVVFGMPRAAIELGAADRVLALDDIPRVLLELAR